FARHAQESAVHLPFMTKVTSPRASIWKSLLEKVRISGEAKVGSAFRLTTPTSEVLTGTVDLVTPNSDLALVGREYDDALLRITMEGKADAPSAFVYGYVIVYSAQRERAATLLDAARTTL